VLTHNVIWHNRAFYFDGSILQPDLVPTVAGQCQAGANYVDIGVLDPLHRVMDPRNGILTSTTGYHSSNVSADPSFMSQYCNGGRGLSNPGPMLATAAFAEGGNFIDVRYGPLTQAWTDALGTDATPWNYHLAVGSPAIDRAPNNGTRPSVGGDHDIDGNIRPIDYPGVNNGGNGGNEGFYDLGADEVPAPAP